MNKTRWGVSRPQVCAEAVRLILEHLRRHRLERPAEGPPARRKLRVAAPAGAQEARRRSEREQSLQFQLAPVRQPGHVHLKTLELSMFTFFCQEPTQISTCSRRGDEKNQCGHHPKSAILMTSSAVTRRLLSFRSRCATPRSCRYLVCLRSSSECLEIHR